MTDNAPPDFKPSPHPFDLAAADLQPSHQPRPPLRSTSPARLGPLPPGRPIAAVDFDAVLHAYTRWDGPEAVGLPIPRVEEGLLALRQAGYRVFIHSTRPRVPIKAWLDRYDLGEYVERITDRKPPAQVFFDDRAMWVPPNTTAGLLSAVEAFMDPDDPFNQIRRQQRGVNDGN